MHWIICRFMSLALAVFLIHPAPGLAAYATHNQRAVLWLSGQQHTDGSWGALATEKFLYTVESVQALQVVGQRNSAYFKGIVWLENHAVANADFKARRILALNRHGDDVSGETQQLSSIQQPGVPGRDAWGLSAAYDASPLDTALVLNSLSVLGAGINVPAAIQYLKATQLSGADQGWPLALETVSNPFTTALVLRTLAILKAQDPTLAVPIANGLGTLITSINAASPPYLLALAAQVAWLAGNPAQAQTWLTRLAGTQAANGSWSARVYDTALVMRTFARADGTDSASQQAPVWMPDKHLRMAINSALGRNAMDSLHRNEMLRLTDLVAIGMDIRDLTGLEWAVNLRTADLRNNRINSTLPTQGLTRLTSLLLDGNPVAIVDNFDEDIPTLPEWGLILMALLLVVSAMWQQRRAQRPCTTPYRRCPLPHLRSMGMLGVLLLGLFVCSDAQSSEPAAGLDPETREAVRGVGQALLNANRRYTPTQDSAALREHIRKVRQLLESLAVPATGTTPIPLSPANVTAMPSVLAPVPAPAWQKEHTREIESLRAETSRLDNERRTLGQARHPVAQKPSLWQTLIAVFAPPKTQSTAEESHIFTPVTEAALARLETLDGDITAALALPDSERQRSLQALAESLRFEQAHPLAQDGSGTRDREDDRAETPTISSRTQHRID